MNQIPPINLDYSRVKIAAAVVARSEGSVNFILLARNDKVTTPSSIARDDNFSKVNVVRLTRRMGKNAD